VRLLSVVILAFCLLPVMPSIVLTVRAVIRLYSGVGYRQTPFTSGYGPMFDFVPDMKTSGAITLLDRLAFYPGQEGNVEITFLYQAYLRHLHVGASFTFGEGRAPLGEGVITEIRLPA
jgi:GTPase